MKNTKHLPAEWHRHQFTQLTWPHAETDWAPVLDDAVECFCNIAREVAKREPLLIVAQYPEQVNDHLSQHGVSTDNITVLQCPTNDTWARDHAFITTLGVDDNEVVLNDFQFNGWGMKFAANLDNQINRNIVAGVCHAYGADVAYADINRIVLEGGSVESDGEGTILTTSSCLLSANRNYVTKDEAEDILKVAFDAKRVLWLDNSWLAGDDTDGHVDTVARFCTPDTIAYVKCYDTEDEHFNTLSAMEKELQAMTTMAGEPYKLVPLPLPDACYDADGERLPATYANFYIMNDAVLVPTYAQPDKDAQAIELLQAVFPDREVIGIDCRVLILQHGSLHCSTMQYPQA